MKGGEGMGMFRMFNVLGREMCGIDQMILVKFGENS